MKKTVSAKLLALLATILLSCSLLALAACGSAPKVGQVETNSPSVAQTDSTSSELATSATEERGDSDATDSAQELGAGTDDSAQSEYLGESSDSSPPTKSVQGRQGAQTSQAIDENGTYTSKNDVALYLHTYGHLPSNYITKDEAEDAGWKTNGLDLDEACPGKSIGGDRFGNREGKLPKAKGRTWFECDIGYKGGSRGAKRIVYSSDGLIYYTEDHYKTFEQLY